MNKFTWNGLTELKDELRQLPAALTADAVPLIESLAAQTAADIKAAYPRRTGRLADRVYVSRTSALGLFNVAAVIRNTSPLAGIFDSGTQARHTSIGANRGSMPPGHVFIPRVMRARRMLTFQLAALVQQHGLTVTRAA